jgi:hypothetical protein
MKPPLELARHDWSSLRVQVGTAERIPEALLDLASAQSDADAERAYWKVDNHVVVQGALYPAAIATASCAVALLPYCSFAGRAWLLELLVQLGNGETAPEAEATGDSNLQSRCAHECLAALAFYGHLLEHGSNAERFHAVDLLGICALEDALFHDHVVWILKQHSESENDRLSALAARWVDELESER